MANDLDIDNTPIQFLSTRQILDHLDRRHSLVISLTSNHTIESKDGVMHTVPLMMHYHGDLLAITGALTLALSQHQTRMLSTLSHLPGDHI